MWQRVSRLRTVAARAARLAVVVVPALLSAQTLLADTGPPVLEVEGMTFVASRGSVREVVLRARTASFDTEVDIVHLKTVRVIVSGGKAAHEMEITCERGQLDLTTSDFRAEGNVRGRMESGLTFTAEWIQYDHDKGLLSTTAPVLITDSAGTLRGGGFQYVVEERRFKLLGGASVVQKN